MASIEQLKEIRQQFAHNVQAVGASLSKPSNGVVVKEAPGAGRFMSGSDKTVSNVAAANDRRMSARVQARTLTNGRDQLAEAKGQSKMMRQQLSAQQEQTQTMKSLHEMMAKFIAASEADRKKLSPKQQEMFGLGARGEDYTGGPKGEGVFDALGNALNDFLSNGLDLFGRGRDRGRPGRNGRNRPGRNNRPGRTNPGWSNPSGPSTSRSWRNKIGDMFGSMKNAGSKISPRGRAGIGAGILTGIGALGYSVFSDDEDDLTASDVSELVRRQQQNTAFGTAPVSGQYTQMPMAHNGVHPDVSWANDQKVYNDAHFTTNSYSGLGAISAINESGGKGVHAISTGRGDAGGVSYGKHQLASNNGSMDAFLRSKEGAQFAHAFHGTQTGSANFNARYAALAAADGENLAKAQQDYTNRTHYEPQLARVSTQTGVDFGQKGRAVQEMLYSTGVQYGPHSEIIVNALKGKDVGSMTDADIIKTVQAYKQQTVGAYFKSSSADVQRSVASRAMREGTQLLALNARDVEAARRGEDPMKAGAIGNIKITNGYGAQSLAAGSRANAQAANMYQVPALVGSNGVVNNEAVSNIVAGATGRFTVSADEAGADIGSAVASGGYLTTGQKHVKLNHARVNMQGLHPKFLQAFYIMVGDWVTNHGGDVCCVESAFRTRAEQEALWIKYGQNTKRVARPGTSRHETGFAIDIDRKSAGAMDSKGLMRKYGFHRPLSNEPWHVEMTAAARNKPIATDAQVNVSSVTPDALSASQEAEIQQQTVNGVGNGESAAPPASNAPVTSPESGAQSAVDAAGATVTAIAAGAGAVIVGQELLSKGSPTTGATDAESSVGKDAAKPDAKGTDAKGKPVVKPTTPDIPDTLKAPEAGRNLATRSADAAQAGKTQFRAGPGKVMPVVGTALTAYEAYDIITDDTLTTDQKQKAGSELAGGTAGAIAGGKAGAAAGAAIGAFFFGAGAVPGAIIGGAVGSIGGYIVGSGIGGGLYDWFNEDGEKIAEAKPIPSDLVQMPPEELRAAIQAKHAMALPAPMAMAAHKAAGATNSPVMSTLAENKLVSSTAPVLPGINTPMNTSAEAAVASVTSKPAPATQPLASTPQTMPIPAGAPTMPGTPGVPGAGAASSLMASAAGAAISAALPTGWGDVIAGDFMQAQAIMANPDAYVPAPAKAPVVTPTASPDSPASSAFYGSDNVALQPSTLAPASVSPVTAQSKPSTPVVSQTGLHVEPVERQQHEPVKSVIALGANKQDTMMPARFKPEGDRIPATGVAQANSARQTLDECPVLISDGGLVLLQTGFI